MINEGNRLMSSTPSTSLRRRIGLAIGAGTLVLLGGAGIAYATTSASEPVETGWAAVVPGDDGRDAASPPPTAATRPAAALTVPTTKAVAAPAASRDP